MKYNDYIYSFIVNRNNFNVPFRIVFDGGEPEHESIFKNILKNAVEIANKNGHPFANETHIAFNFISLVYSGKK